MASWTDLGLFRVLLVQPGHDRTRLFLRRHRKAEPVEIRLDIGRVLLRHTILGGRAIDQFGCHLRPDRLGRSVRFRRLLRRGSERSKHIVDPLLHLRGDFFSLAAAIVASSFLPRSSMPSFLNRLFHLRVNFRHAMREHLRARFLLLAGIGGEARMVMRGDHLQRDPIGDRILGRCLDIDAGFAPLAAFTALAPGAKVTALREMLQRAALCTSRAPAPCMPDSPMASSCAVSRQASSRCHPRE